jgi:hypothetical protein
LVRVISAGVAADYGIDVWSAGVTAFELWFDGKWIVDRTFAEDGAVIMPSGISNGSDVDDITGLTLAELHVLKVCLDVHDSTGEVQIPEGTPDQVAKLFRMMLAPNPSDRASISDCLSLSLFTENVSPVTVPIPASAASGGAMAVSGGVETDSARQPELPQPVTDEPMSHGPPPVSVSIPEPSSAVTPRSKPSPPSLLSSETPKDSRGNRSVSSFVAPSAYRTSIDNRSRTVSVATGLLSSPRPSGSSPRSRSSVFSPQLAEVAKRKHKTDAILRMITRVIPSDTPRLFVMLPDITGVPSVLSPAAVDWWTKFTSHEWSSLPFM